MQLIDLKEVSRFVRELKKRENKPLIITDSNVAGIYKELLEEINIPYIALPAGEGSKSMESKLLIEDYLFSNNFPKRSELIAFGGGVISDLVGFVASTYMRGIEFSVIPTTVICMVDASIGGKNGINTKYGKNLIGTFYDPIDICNEHFFFKTLSKNLQKEQFSEIVKIALVLDRELFFSMDDPIEKAKTLKEMIVTGDKKDQGIRKILNFGHTFAHAYEKLMDYKISHGFAVWIGIYFESLLSFKLNILPPSEWRIIKLFLSLYISSFDFKLIDGEDLFKYMLLDKKNINSKPHFILISKIGTVHKDADYITHAVNKADVVETFNQMKVSM